ncbi:MAG: hypothetical protein KAR19_19695 [Bacteroidales bacterium]|nr:hypothetical protein [Bacteroidales bacterium]
MKNNSMEKAKDLLTDEEFVKRRNNQRFASRQNQIRYNNMKAQEKRNIKSQVDRILLWLFLLYI